MDLSGLSLPILQTSDLQNVSTFSDASSLSYLFPTIPISISASIPLIPEGLRTLPTIKDEKSLRLEDCSTTQAIQDIVNSTLAIPIRMSESHFSQSGDGGKERQEIMAAGGGHLSDDKGMSPLNILVVSYPDTGQQSPLVAHARAQGLRFQTAGGAGDAMLSAINYNDSEMLPDSAFEMNTANTTPNLPQLDDGILGSMGNPAQNIRLPEGQAPHAFDLFDSNVHDSLSLSPQPFSDQSFSVTDASNLSTAGDSEGSIPERRQSVESPTDGASKSKGKNRQPKTPLSPSKNLTQCPTCHKVFNNSSALAKHRLTHSDERKYVCTVCHKGFKRQDHLNGHMMTHREKKPYQCQMEGCEKSYCDARSLRRHLEANHHQSPEAIASSVLASMAAAGIPATTHGGKSRPADKAQDTVASRMQQLTSTTYSTNTTPTPTASPSYTSPNPQAPPGQVFQFEGQASIPTVVATQQATPPHEQTWQDRARVYDFVETSTSSQPSPHSEEQSPVYAAQVSPVTPVSPLPHNQPTSPQTGRPAWFNSPSSAAAETKNTGDDTKPPVQCSICQRRFKNIPALNGHMRLHGGYVKKSKEEKKGKKTEMGPPPPPPRQQTATATVTPASSALPVQVNPVLPNISQAFQSMSTAPESTTSQSLLQAGGLMAVTVHPDHIDTQLLRQPHPVVQQHLQLHPTTLEEQRNSIEEQIKNLQAQQAFHHQEQLAAQEQITSSHSDQQAAHQAAQQIQQLVQSVQADQLPQLTVQQLEQLQQSHIQVHPLGQIHQLPQLSAQQLEQLQQQHLQLGLPAQLQASQLHQLVQDQHLQQLQQQAQQPAQPEATHTESAAGTQQFIQLSPQQLQQILEDTKENTEKQQQIQRIQQHLASVDQHSGTQQNPFPQNVEFTSTGDVHIAQSQTQDIPQQISLDIGTRDLPPNLELQLQQQLLPLQSPPITLNSVAIQSSLQTALSLAQMPQLEHRPILSGVGQAQFISGPQLTTALSPGTDSQEVTVAQLLSSMANFQDGLLLQASSQGPNSDISVIPAQPSVTIHQGGLSVPSSFHPLHTISQPVSVQSLPAQFLDNINISLPHLQPPKSEHLPVHNPGSDMLARLKSEFKPVSEHHSELKRRLSADSDMMSAKRVMTSQNNLSTMLGKGVGSDDRGSFAKPATSSSKETDLTARIRFRSKSGDDHKLKRSKSVDHTFMRPRSRTESESLYRPMVRTDESVSGRSNSHPDELLSKSDGAGVFRNPMMASPMKVKRKNRPAPLFIPLHLNSFQSRLRSPRLWDGNDGRPRGSTPPPYTPPPMLSPIRSGSGLFWSIHGGKPITPRSAPVTPKLILSGRRASFGQKQESIPEVAEEEHEGIPPETDIQPHVNVGTMYQVELPSFNPNRRDAGRSDCWEDIVWEPSAMGANTDDDVQSYQDFACSAAVKGNGANVEYALHLLNMCKGNVQDAMLLLMNDPPKLPKNHNLSAYRYQESDTWTSVEIEAYHQALLRFSKDFFAVSREVKTKTTKQCIQFYYLWKKVCPEDYKKLRILRRKREQEALYNLRSRQQQAEGGEQQQPPQQPAPEEYDSEDSHSAHSWEQNDARYEMESTFMSSSTSPAPTFSCDYPDCHAAFTSKHSLHGHMKIHATATLQHNYVKTAPEATVVSIPPAPAPAPPPPPPPLPPPVQRKPRPTHHKPPPPPTDGTGEVFPCKLCSRVFAKVKSRSAHMKSHKVQDNAKKEKMERELELMAMKAVDQ